MIGTLKAYAVAFMAALAAFAGVVLYRKGKGDADNENQIQEQDDYIHTRKQMDQANEPSDDDIVEWLRKRGGKSGGSL